MPGYSGDGDFMFQSFRNQKRWLMLIAMILIIPAFIFIGINGYSRLNPDANAIAKVDGQGIQPEEFDQAKRQFIENRRIQQGGTVDASEFDTPEINHAILYNLTTNRALNAELQHNYMQVSEADVINYIKRIPAFQKDGKFEPQLYENYLAARGKSDQMFVYELRGELARELLINGVKATVSVPKKTSELLNNILREERVVRTMVFDPAAYEDGVKITDEQIQAYYNAHKADFQAPETVDIEYVVFSPETVSVTALANEDELKQFYEQNKSRFGQEETRRASHILIAPGEGAEAKAKAILEQVKANPAKLAEVAKKESADIGSAEFGGDLDFFARGQMVPEFEDAVFAAKKGDIVGPVKSEYGYHIIYVTDIDAARVKTFEEVRSEIEATWAQQKKQEAFAENADNFTNMVYEQSDSLEPVVEKFGLKVMKLNGLTKSGVANNEFINRRVVEDLFAPDSIEEKRNTSAAEIRANTLVSARVTKHVAAHEMSLDEVKGRIVEQLKLEEAAKLAKSAGEAKLKTLLAKKDLNGFGHEQTVSRLRPLGQSAALVQAELEVPADKLPAFASAQQKDGSFVIAYVISSKLPEANDEEARQIRSEAQTRQSMGDELAYYDALKKVYQLEFLKKEYDYKLPKALN